MLNRNNGRPNAWETRCLEQLDDAKIWASLGREMPRREEPLPGEVSRLIFRFNLWIFIAVVAGMMTTFGVALGTTWAEFSQPTVLAPSLIALAGLSTGLATFVTSIYRRSWNRRVARIELERTGTD